MEHEQLLAGRLTRRDALASSGRDAANDPSALCRLQAAERRCALLRRMEICVAEAEKRSGRNAVNMQETFTMYLVETR